MKRQRPKETNETVETNGDTFNYKIVRRDRNQKRLTRLQRPVKIHANTNRLYEETERETYGDYKETVETMETSGEKMYMHIQNCTERPMETKETRKIVGINLWRYIQVEKSMQRQRETG